MISLERLSILNPAGGLRYHWRARKYRDTLWSDYIESLHDWLSQWKPREKNLILVGPSAGHCLKPEFIARFDRLLGIEIDPMARWLFTRRFGSQVQHVGWITQDLLLGTRGDLEVRRFREVLDAHPDYAVLFCNFLGQLPAIFPEAIDRPSFKSFCNDLRQVLEGRSWCSFHDRLSGEAEPLSEGQRINSHPTNSGIRPLSNDALARRFYRSIHSPGSAPAPIELMDHQTGEIFQASEARYFSWQLMPGIFHLIEGVRR